MNLGIGQGDRKRDESKFWMRQGAGRFPNVKNTEAGGMSSPTAHPQGAPLRKPAMGVGSGLEGPCPQPFSEVWSAGVGGGASGGRSLFCLDP